MYSRIAVSHDGAIIPHVVMRLNDSIGTLVGDVVDNLRSESVMIN